MSDSRTWPELGEELGRKALETLLRRSQENADGLLDDAAFGLILETITDCIAGLVKPEVSDLVYEARQQITGEPDRKRRRR